MERKHAGVAKTLAKITLYLLNSALNLLSALDVAESFKKLVSRAFLR